MHLKRGRRGFTRDILFSWCFAAAVSVHGNFWCPLGENNCIEEEQQQKQLDLINAPLLNVLWFILDDEFLEVDNNPIIGRCTDHSVAVNVGRILVWKARTGHTDSRSVACQVEGAIAVQHPFREVRLRGTIFNEPKFGVSIRGKGNLGLSLSITLII